MKENPGHFVPSSISFAAAVLLLGQGALYLPAAVLGASDDVRFVVLFFEAVFRATALVAATRVLLGGPSASLGKYFASAAFYIGPSFLLRLVSIWLETRRDAFGALAGVGGLLLVFAVLACLALIPWSLLSGGSVREGFVLARKNYRGLLVAIGATFIAKVVPSIGYRAWLGLGNPFVSGFTSALADLVFMLLCCRLWEIGVRGRG